MKSPLPPYVRPRRIVRPALVCLALALPVAVLPAGVSSAEGAVASVTGLSQGSRGDAVRALQQALLNKGIAVTGGVDGIFGAGTASALKQFQSSNGLAATGVVDDATALALGLASSPLLGLSQGARGDAVRQLQQKLVDSGIAVSGGVDGIYGSGTAAAVSQFQSSKGLAATGAVNASTAAALGGVTAVATPAPGSSSTAEGASLRIGSRGEAVKAVQRQLQALGIPLVGGADGVFGALTANAVTSFQQSKGLPANGVVDSATAAALSSAAAGGGAATGSPGAALVGLKLGSRGDAVKQLQTSLISSGIAVRGGADGVFGSATQTALQQYQQAIGVSATGQVDEPTASALASGRTVGSPTSTLVGLKSGALGTPVKALQEALIKAGTSVRGGADGIFGPATSQALMTFQTSQGLQATGVVDNATAAALANPKPPVSAAASTDGYAVFGEKGTHVMALQAALVKAGIAVKGGVDGDFGAGTSAAVMDFQRAHGLGVTGKVNDATANALGLAKGAAPAPPDPGTVTLEVFPVQGRCQFGDSYGYARSGGRVHLGVDIIAPAGKLIYAVTAGTITKIYADYPGSLSGNGVRLTTADGTYYFYAHMTGIANGIAVGAKVKAGQILGTVGSTGNSGTNHLHLEIHPRGGSAINPYPLVKAIDACSVTDPRPQ